jgi:hypothetical protein
MTKTKKSLFIFGNVIEGQKYLVCVSDKAERFRTFTINHGEVIGLFEAVYVGTPES